MKTQILDTLKAMRCLAAFKPLADMGAKLPAVSVSPKYNPERPVGSNTQIGKMLHYLAYADQPSFTMMQAIKMLKASSAGSRVREMRKILAMWDIELRHEWLKGDKTRYKRFYISYEDQANLRRKLEGK